MPNSPEVASARGRLVVAHRHHRDDVEAIADRRRDLAAAKIAQYIADVLAAAPPLTDAQRARLAALLRPTPSASAR